MADPSGDSSIRAWLADVAAADSAAAEETASQLHAYGALPDNTADVWEPRGVAPLATVVSLHGGYFADAYRRDLNTPLSRALAGRGVRVVNAEYRRAGAGGFDATAGDVLAAVAWAADTWPSTRGLAVVGHSAGGYLAGWCTQHPAVDLVVSMGGVGDLRTTVTSGVDGGAVVDWLGASPHADPALYDLADLAMLPPARARWLLIHGDNDRVVPIEQANALAAARRSVGDTVDVDVLAGDGHFAFLDPREGAAQRVIEHLTSWAEGSAMSHSDA